LSFVITAAVALALATSVIFREFRSKPSPIRRKLLNGYSDLQIIQGIGIQSVGLGKMDSLVPYHFFIIWMLSLLSMATHNATLLALAQDFRRDWVIRWMRQFLMFVNLVLSCVSGIFVLQAVSKGLDTETVPMSCVWVVDEGFGGPPKHQWISYIGTIAVIVGNCVVFGLASWYLQSRQQRWYKLVQIIGMIIMTASAVGAAVRIGLASQAFNGSPKVDLEDHDERDDWSFGQLLSLLLLALPLLSAVEIYRGQVKVAAVEEDRQPLYDGELQSHPTNRYQPSPFHGSEANFNK